MGFSQALTARLNFVAFWTMLVGLNLGVSWLVSEAAKLEEVLESAQPLPSILTVSENDSYPVSYSSFEKLLVIVRLLDLVFGVRPYLARAECIRGEPILLSI